MGNRNSRKITHLDPKKTKNTGKYMASNVQTKDQSGRSVSPVQTTRENYKRPLDFETSVVDEDVHSTVFEYASDALALSNFSMYTPENEESTPINTEDKLARKLELLSTAFEYAPDCIILMQHDIILAINPAGCKLFGWENSELVGANLCSTLIPQVYRSRHREGVKSFVETGVARLLNSRKAVSLKGLHKSGDQFPIHLSISAVKLPTNDYIFVGFIRDVTALVDEIKHKEQLLHSIMPKPIATRLINQQKRNEASARSLFNLGNEEDDLIADSYQNASVGFLDMVGFTPFTSHLSPTKLVKFLNDLFSDFDNVFLEYDGLVEKIKTMGDAVMFVSGLPERRSNHANLIMEFALRLIEVVNNFESDIIFHSASIQIRIGLHCGPLVAAVVGTRKPFYDIYGDTVNVASRMESSGEAGLVQITRAFLDELVSHHGVSRIRELPYEIIPRGNVEVKGKGSMETFLVSRKK